MVRAVLSFNFTYRLLSPIYDRACFLQHPNTLRQHATSQFQSLGSVCLRLVHKGCQIDRHLPAASRASWQRHPVSGRRSSGMKVVVIYVVFVGLSNDPSWPNWRLLLPQRLHCLVSIFIVNYAFSSIPIVSSSTHTHKVKRNYFVS